MNIITVGGILICITLLYILIRGLKDIPIYDKKMLNKEINKIKKLQKERYEVKKIYKIPEFRVSPHYLFETLITMLIKNKTITKEQADKMIEESTVKLFG